MVVLGMVVLGMVVLGTVGVPIALIAGAVGASKLLSEAGVAIKIMWLLAILVYTSGIIPYINLSNTFFQYF
jgi:hypothetical protein